MISGSKPAVRATREPDSDLDLDDPLLRDMSASSVRSAPVILERPSSRGGSAFDISFEEEQQNATPYEFPPRARADVCRGLPRRLKRLEERNSSGKKKREELTLEELQAKLLAAEVRRKVSPTCHGAAREHVYLFVKPCYVGVLESNGW